MGFNKRRRGREGMGGERRREETRRNETRELNNV